MLRRSEEKGLFFSGGVYRLSLSFEVEKFKGRNDALEILNFGRIPFHIG